MTHKTLVMLSPKAVQIEYIAGGFASLTQSDICHAMSGMRPILTRIAYALFVYTDRDIDEVIGDCAAKGDIIRLRDELAATLSERLDVSEAKALKLSTAILATNRNGLACRRCNGQRTYLATSGEWVDCRKCDLTGFDRASKAELSRITGIHPKTWAECYEKDYAKALAVFETMKSAIYSHIATRLYAEL